MNGKLFSEHWCSSRLHSWSYTYPSINDLPRDAIHNIAIFTDYNTFSYKCDQESDFWQQLELASELECDPRDTLDWGRKLLDNFNARKTELVWFDWSNNSAAIDVTMDGSVLEKSTFKILGLSFSSELNRRSQIISIT